MDKLECLISKAEIAYKSGKIAQAVKFADHALAQIAVSPVASDMASKTIALRIFIARGLCKLGKFTESTKIYRELLKEKVYIAPVVLGLFYNNFCVNEASEKINLNMVLVKSCLLLP